MEQQTAIAGIVAYYDVNGYLLDPYYDGYLLDLHCGLCRDCLHRALERYPDMRLAGPDSPYWHRERAAILDRPEWRARIGPVEREVLLIERAGGLL